MEKLDLNPDPRLQPAPSRTAFDYGITAAKAGALAFPFLGAGVALVDLVTTPLRSKRLTDWCEDLRLAFNELSQKIEGLTPEKLAENDQFVSASLRALQSAVRTHQAEKLEALKNAILNVAVGGEPEADRQTVFLDLVDRFTPLHLALLQFFQDPAGYISAKRIEVAPQRDNQPIFFLLLDCMPDLRQQTASPVEGRDGAQLQFLDIVVTELANACLVTPDLKNGAQKPPRYPRWTTHLGDDFLDFISPPGQGKKP